MRYKWIFASLAALVVSAPAKAEDDDRAAVYPAVGQPVSLAGTLHVLWGDPGPGCGEPSQRRFFLDDDAGNAWVLLLDDETLMAAGGFWAVNRQRVVITGWSASARRAQLSVDTLRLEQPSAAERGEGLRVSGSQPYVWILLRFGDNSSTPQQPTWYQTQATGPAPSLDHFWRELSFNNIDIVGSTVVGWYTLPHPRSYYVYDIDPNDPGDEVNFNRCLDDAVALADPDVYFPNFIGINLIFNDTLDCCAWGGGRNITADGQTKGYGVTWMPPWGWYEVGYLGHEMGHSLGLPHSSGPYGETYDSNWDVMSHALGTCAQSDPVYGCLGTHTIGYHKDMLSWIPAGRRYVVGSTPAVTTLFLYDLAVVPPAGYYHYVRIPTGSNSFYTVERRCFTGYDQNVAGEAVVLHRVDYAIDDHARVVDPDGNGNCNDAGAQWLAGETFYDSTNSVLVTVDWAGASSSQVTFTKSPRSPVYADLGNGGYEDGSAANPWNTVREGYGAVIPSGTVYIKPGTYLETVTMSKPATLQRNGTSGTVTIGP